MSMNDIVNCIPSKDLREFLTNHPISLSTLQKATIVSEFASRRQKIRLLTKLGEETEDESEKILLSTAIDEIKKFGYTGEATNEVYKTLFPHKGFPIYPFLEVCNLPVLYKEGDLLIFRRHHFLVAGGPELRENACDFTDECYYCYDLSVKTKSEEDLFKNHEHIHVCEAESAPIDRLSRHEKRNMEYVKEVIRSHLEERKTLGLYDRLKMEGCSTEDEGDIKMNENEVFLQEAISNLNNLSEEYLSEMANVSKSDKMNLQEAIKVLNEGATDLYKGIFWIVDQDDVDNNKNYCFVIPTNSSGEIVSDIQLNAKSGSTYNHERTWENLSDAMKHNKPFDYYPRGRVEISNGKALIYLNPNINTEEVKKFIIQEFHLYNINGITMVRTISDGSSHYRCYLDR